MRLDAWRNAGRRFDYRGYPVFYRREGQGPALLLIHGFPTASWDWHRLWPGLVERYDVIAPDLLGFGFSAKPPRYPYRLMDQASLVEALLQSLESDAVHVLAHDYGDTVAQELLARHDERRAAGAAGLAIRSVCLLNGGIFPGVHRPLPIQRLLMTPVGAWLAPFLTKRTLRRSFDRIFGPRTRPTEAEIDDFWTLIEHGDGRRIVHRLIRYMAERETHRDRWVGAIVNARVPLRLIAGPEDPISGAHLVEHYRRVVPAPDVVELAGIGHYPQVEAPAEVLAAFLAFVDRVEAAGGATARG